VSAYRPLFSVVIPTYGRQRFLDDAIASVLHQSIEDLECIVVDDAGPEPAVIPRDPRVSLFRRETNGGPAAARNSGLDIARGRFVCFLDDDDLYTPNRLSLVTTSGSAPVSICSRSTLGEGNRWSRDLNGPVHDTILDGLIPSLGQVSVAKDGMVFFDETFDGAQDLEWWLRLTANNEVTTVEEVGYLVRSHDGPRHRNGTVARIRGSLRLMEIHADYFETHPRARSFRWRRIGLMAMSLGETNLAGHAFRASLRAKATPRSAWHLARSFAADARRKPEVADFDQELRSEVLSHAR